MAETYKNARSIPADTNYNTAYTCPAATTAIVKTILVANNHTSAVDASVQWLDNSNSDAATVIAYAISIPPNATLSVLPAPIVLEASDALQVKTSDADELEFTVAVLQLT